MRAAQDGTKECNVESPECSRWCSSSAKGFSAGRSARKTGSGIDSVLQPKNFKYVKEISFDSKDFSQLRRYLGL
jgi:hypothetical protein